MPPARDHASPAAGDALACSVTALTEALSRLDHAAGTVQAVAAATEAAWWVITTDAAMNRSHPAAYARALAALDPAARRAVERSLTGLRYVRSQLGHNADPADFIQPQTGNGTSQRPAAWTWAALAPPPAQRGTTRDASPYREYRTQLTGRPVAEALTLAASFLAQAYAAARAGQRTLAAPRADRLRTGLVPARYRLRPARYATRRVTFTACAPSRS